MKRLVLAAAAVLALAACDAVPGLTGGAGGGGPSIPETPAGAQAPTVLEGGAGGTQQAQISAEERGQLEALVRGYVDDVQSNFGSGMAPAAGFQDVIVPMQPNTDHRWNVDLVAGTPYRFIGACDNECSNLDFELIAPGGGVVASDLLPDDYPVAEFTPTENGRYIARMLMRTCTIAPCYAGARVLSAAPAATPTGLVEDK